LKHRHIAIAATNVWPQSPARIPWSMNFLQRYFHHLKDWNLKTFNDLRSLPRLELNVQAQRVE
jgi:hypothetical protein